MFKSIPSCSIHSVINEATIPIYGFNLDNKSTNFIGTNKLFESNSTSDRWLRHLLSPITSSSYDETEHVKATSLMYPLNDEGTTYKFMHFFYVIEFDNHVPELYVYMHTHVAKNLIIDNADRGLYDFDGYPSASRYFWREFAKEYDHTGHINYENKVWVRQKAQRFLAPFLSDPKDAKVFQDYREEVLALAAGKGDLLKIVEHQGDSIKDIYLDDDYPDSCMSYDYKQDYLDIYANNDVSLLTFKNDHGSGRVIVFRNDKYYFVSRFYSIGKYSNTMFRDSVKKYMAEAYPDLKYGRVDGARPKDPKPEKDDTWVYLDIPSHHYLPYFDNIEEGWHDWDTLALNFYYDDMPSVGSWERVYLGNECGGELNEDNGRITCYYTDEYIHEDDALRVYLDRYDVVLASEMEDGCSFHWSNYESIYVDDSACFYCKATDDYYPNWRYSEILLKDTGEVICEERTTEGVHYQIDPESGLYYSMEYSLTPEEV